MAKPPAKARFLPGDRWKNDIDEPGTAYLDDESGRLYIQCPHGVPGDRLWVRETWTQLDADYRPIGRHKAIGELPDEYRGCPIAYRADHLDPKGDGPGNPMPWRPSIHMPRWASRITLEITGVRVERLNSISLEDALAEGVHWDVSRTIRPPYTGPCVEFRSLWDTINGKSHPWASNPFCWVIEFRKVD